jgi:hypothetical protein
MMIVVDVEKTIAFILDCQARTEAALAASAEELADTKRTINENAKALKATDTLLRRAIRAGVRDARNERRKRQEMDRKFDEKITQIAAAHLLTEEALKALSTKVDAFIDSMGRRTNGHS